MSRLTDLLRAAKQLDPQLGADLEEELKPLQKRLPFGLNFERHAPEAVELPGHKIRKMSKVRVLPPRGSTERGDQRLWKVESLSGDVAEISLLDVSEPETATVSVDDLVLVAEFRDRIYPGLRPDGTVERGGDKPFHTVINGENFHVLEQLTFTHEHAVDAIYIDPPYNSGAKDWKYNNDYVEGDDLYRHSKWLAFMERRLKVAKRLLKPDDSVLVVTIDEKEYLRLGLLLEQTFPEAAIEMVTSVISAKGVARVGQFSRVEEYVFVVRIGEEQVGLGESNMLDGTRSASAQIGQPISWLGLRRREPTARRGARPKQFYPVFIDESTGYVESIGDPITDDVDRASVPVPAGAFAAWPLLPDGTEGLWGVTPETARSYLAQGFLRARNYKPSSGYVSVQYLPSGTVAAIEDGRIKITGRDEDEAVVGVHTSAKGVIPKRVWNAASHNAETGGTNLISALLGKRRFPFPKSLYAVEDTLRFFVADKPHAVVLDFFSGSGTTAHAVMRLNRQDGGRRQCISVTNNEVSADEQARLRKKKLRPGDSEWEKWGICDYITKPRIRASVSGETPDGSPIKGDYKFVDEFPMADGFKENAAFFTLTYESPWMVSNDKAFAAIAPMLWLRAGAQGERIDALGAGWAVADTYGVLRDLDQSAEFVAALKSVDGIRIGYIVTDDEGRYQQVADELRGIETVRLYEDYLRNCESTGDL